MDKKTKNEEIYEIIHALKPQNIPPEFISSARIYDFDGNSWVADVDELEDIVTSPNSFEEMGIKSIQLNMDIEAIVHTVVDHS
jgi:hypothetical protein